MSLTDRARRAHPTARAHALHRPWPRAHKHLVDLHLIDLLSVGYMTAVAVLILLHSGRVGGWQLLVTGHLALIVMAVGLPQVAGRRPRSELLGLLRIYYPALVLAWAYLEMDLVQPMLFGDWRGSDWLARMDVAVFGTHPTVAVERLHGSLLDEVFALVYLAYYLVPVVVSAWFLRRGRRDDLLATGGAVALTYFTNFVLFLLVPAVGPRSVPGLAELHHGHYDGPLFARICLLVEGDAGPIAGAVFPSSHVSATLAWGLAALRHDRRLGLPAIGVGLGIMPATVYLGYHHAIDALAGAVLPLATVPAAFALMRGAQAAGADGPARRLKGHPMIVDATRRAECSSTSRLANRLRGSGGELGRRGVVYRPESELMSHYFQAVLPVQFDEYIWFEETRAVNPLGPAITLRHRR